MGISDKVEKSLDWYTRVKGFFEPFKPETRHVTLNHRQRNCQIHVHIKAPAGIRRSFAKVQIPAYPGFKVKEIIDESFTRVPNGFRLEEGYWKLDTSKLPASENYLVMLEGTIDPTIVKELVRIQPATNRDQTEELDRYWLDAMIKDVEKLRDVWKFMEVEEVDVSVRVSVERCFADILPQDVQERFDATTKYLEAGRTPDRNALFKSWQRFRIVTKDIKIESERMLRLGRRMLDPEEFSGYLSVDSKKGEYAIGEISSPSSIGQNLFPDKVMVNAITNLNYDLPGATGYLNFKKKLFRDELVKQLESAL